MAIDIEMKRSANDQVLQAALAWWQAHRPTGYDLRQHLDNPTVNINGNDSDRHLALAIARAVEIGLI